MSDLVGISSTAVQTYQKALGTVSNNIANVGTEGYTRQVSDLSSTAPKRVGQAYLGTGVELQSIKREVDEFVQKNLRDSNSALANQKPMVDYANRVVDLLGGDSTGLIGALSKFFESARSLSIDPSSVVSRSMFLAESENLASRFNELSGQLDAVSQEVEEYLSVASREVNTLASELAQINGQLSSQKKIDRQPPALLDQRDLVLQKLSALVRLKTQFKENGGVAVSIGPTITKGLIVEGDETNSLSVTRNKDGEFVAVLDPYGEAEPVARIEGGEIGGLMALSLQVLRPAMDRLDHLAATLADSVNAIHQEGIDMFGEVGGDLFGFEAKGSAAASIHVLISDTGRVATGAQFRVTPAEQNLGNGSAEWTFSTPVDDPNSLALTTESGSTSPYSLSVADGQNLSLFGSVGVGLRDVSVFLDGSEPGQELQVITKGGVHVLGRELDFAGELSLKESGYIGDDTSVVTDYLNNQSGESFKGITVVYGAFATTRAVEQFAASGESLGVEFEPLEIIGGPIASNLTGEIAASGAFAVNGISLGALSSRSDEPLEATDVADWLNSVQIDGVVASAVGEHTIAAEAIDLSADLTLSGRSAQGPVTVAGGHETLRDLADAINRVSDETLVQAHIDQDGALVLSNLEQYAGQRIQIYESLRLMVEGPASTADTAQITVPTLDPIEVNLDAGDSATMISQKLAAAIEANAEARQNNIRATVTVDGHLDVHFAAQPDRVVAVDLTFSQPEQSGLLASVDSAYSSNALGLGAIDLMGSVTVRDARTPSEGALLSIDMTAPGGVPTLRSLGFRPGLHLPGELSEEFNIFVSGAGEAAVSAVFGQVDADLKTHARTSPFEIQFTASDEYQLTDVATGSILTKQKIDLHQSPIAISYNGIEVKLTSPPVIGDRFIVDGNEGGYGDNSQALAIAELETSGVLEGGRTFNDAYVEQLSSVGNAARQAKVAQEALGVVYEQAVAQRESVSGVSLDQEAADLIRFQQAYQASAKVMQTASTLFDSIIAI